MANEIVLENQKQGNPESEWGLPNGASSSIEGFTTDISTNLGGTVDFKIDTDSSNYRIDIYRLGYYGGDGARKVATIQHTGAVNQPNPIVQLSTATVDAGNWSVTDSWTVPTDAVSGVYFAKLVRQDGTAGENRIPFVVRDDDGHSDVMFQTSDATWQAYNSWGGAGLYGNDLGTGANRAFAVSYNRPVQTEGVASFMGVEYSALRWLEENGYDVSYSSGVDTARSGSELLEHKVFLSVGHDEYWSQEARDNVEAARDAGVNLAFWSGNEIYWKTRWAPSLNSTPDDYRTMVSYKESYSGTTPDPSPIWTGTWRDPNAPDGSQPENALTGTIFAVNSHRDDTVTVPYEYSNLRFWNNTTIADLQPGQVASLTPSTLGYEWDVAPDNGFRPAGLVELSSTTVYTDQLQLSYANTTIGSGPATHSLTLYRAPSGALVFGAGSIFWSWGLDFHHDPDEHVPNPPADPDVQQAMINLLAEMGVQPGTLQSWLVPATQSTDHTPPTTEISSLESINFNNSLRGTASDSGGGIVAGVEVSVDGGFTWHPARGTTNWSYDWVGRAATYSVLARAMDDSINLGPATSAELAVATAPVFDDFSKAQGWSSTNYVRELVDLNHDGKMDYLGFGSSKTLVSYGVMEPGVDGDQYGFSDATNVISNFAKAQGYSSAYQRGAADTGYGLGATIYAQANRGLMWSGATTATDQTDAAGNTYSELQYESPHLYAQFGKQQGWSNHNGFDVVFVSPTDQYASVLGFGSKGITVGPQAFAPDASAQDSYNISLPVGNKQGWDQLIDVRTFADNTGDAIDLNHDGIVDFVGMGPTGTVFAYGSSDVNGEFTLGNLETAHIKGTGSDFGRAQGWQNSTTPREIIKDPVTGYYDIIAFGSDGVSVAMGQDPATHGGEPFGQRYLAMSDMGSSQGWNSKTVRLVQDINNDGAPDIVGFGNKSTFVAMGARDENGDLHFTIDDSQTIPDFGYSQGWDATTVRTIAQSEHGGEHDASLVLSGSTGTSVWDLLA